MKFTNLMGLPGPIVEAVTRHKYSKGKSDFSASELNKPERQRALQLVHRDEITEDVADRIWALMGTLGHQVLEQAYYGEVDDVLEEIKRLAAKNDYEGFVSAVSGIWRKLRDALTKSGLAEQRLFMDLDVDGATYRISGKFDLLRAERRIVDYKFTTTWGCLPGKPVKDDWVAQGNTYFQLAKRNGIEDLEGVDVVAILRDWSKPKARTSDGGYPKKGVLVIPLPIWSDDQYMAWVGNRIRAHRLAEVDLLPECSDEDRWASSGTWAALKAGNKKASKLSTDKAELERYAAEAITKSKGKAKFSIDWRPGESKRCLDYCNVAEFCSQWKEIQGSLDSVSDPE